MRLEFSLVFPPYESGIVNFMDKLRAYKVSRFGFLSEKLKSKVTINHKNFDRCKSSVISQGSESFSGRFSVLCFTYENEF